LAATAKKRHTRHRYDGILADAELESMYIEDGLAARIVNLLPSDMFREGWNYTFPDMDELKAEEITDTYKEILEAIGAQQKIKEAQQWARLYGGGVILIGVIDSQTMDTPLNSKRIKSFEKLKIIDRTDIDFDKIQFQLDPLKPRYGLPEYYPIKFDISAHLESEKLVHHSRIIEIHGDTLPSGAKTTLTAEQRYWGISVLQRADERLKTLGTSFGSIDQLLQEISVGKYKIKDLAMLLSSTEGKDAITRRVELMDLTRSVFRSQYLDADEEYSRDTINFTGVPEILHILFMLIAADTGYPITRLFGMSPAGMNSTGESDMRNYYDMVRSEQTNILQPILLRLVRIISEWKNIPEPYIEFVPLQTLNEKERADLEKQKADTEKVQADTYKAYIDMGILEPYEARFLKFGNTLDAIPAPPQEDLPPVDETDPPPESDKDEPPKGDEPAADDNAAKKATKDKAKQ
jgi:phage-related protein (TIGR01555 family)